MNCRWATIIPDGLTDVVTSRDSTVWARTPSASSRKNRGIARGGDISETNAAPPPLMFSRSPRAIRSVVPSSQLRLASICRAG